MIKKLKLQHLKLAIPLFLLVFLVGLVKTQTFQADPSGLSFGILLDLLITIPIVYFLLIRKTDIPNFTTLYVFLIGIFAASFILPNDQQSLLDKVKLIAIPIIEIGILSTVIYKIFALKKSFKSKKSDTNDFYDNLLVACNEIFPGRVGRVLATEVSVFYYLFAPRRKSALRKHEFTYFKKSGIVSVVGVFLFLVLVETIVAHILLEKWNVYVAWVMTGLGLYTIIQILAILRSLNKRLILIDHETKELRLRYGFGCQSTIPFSHIERIEKSRKSLPKDKYNTCLSLFDLLDTHNTILYLNETQVLNKIYGIQKKYKTIALHIDEQDAFLDELGISENNT